MNAASYITIYAEKAASAAAKAAITTDARDKDFLLREVRKYENLSQGARESAQRAAAQVVAAQPVQAPKVEAKKEAAKPAKVRCPHYKAIRRMFAVAQSAGLNCQNKKGMRAAFSALLGKPVVSRADLTAADYGRAVQSIEAGLMWW